MSAKNQQSSARAAAKRNDDAPKPAPAPVALDGTPTAETIAPFYERHPKIANALFAALCVYVAMLGLLALDQTFHWGIFGPQIPPLP